jgi:hypothetical protein
LIPEAEAVEFINDMSRATGVLVSFGVNAYYGDLEPGSAFVFFIDPSSLDGYSESKLESYIERRGFRLHEEWNDWGRFLKVTKPRRVFVSAFSP